MVDKHFELDGRQREDAGDETPLQTFMRGASQVVAAAVITALFVHLIASRLSNLAGYDVEAITFAASGLAIGLAFCHAILAPGKRS